MMVSLFAALPGGLSFPIFLLVIAVVVVFLTAALKMAVAFSNNVATSHTATIDDTLARGIGADLDEMRAKRSAGPIPSPSLPIAFVLAIVTLALAYVVAIPFLYVVTGDMLKTDAPVTDVLLAVLLSVPFGLLTHGILFKFTLPTTYRHGMSVHFNLWLITLTTVLFVAILGYGGYRLFS